MVEGVRHGAAQTSGELGLAEEFGKFPAGWDNRPVVMNHPKVNKQFVSANSPTVLESYQFGITLHTEVADEKLKMEAWLNTSMKDKNTDIKRVFERVEANEVIEVSVGFFTEVEEEDGTFDGETFTGIWRNIVPDHLAFLSEGSTGACSVEDGCGAPRINEQGKQGEQGEQDKQEQTVPTVPTVETQTKKKPMPKSKPKGPKGYETAASECNCHKQEVVLEENEVIPVHSLEMNKKAKHPFSVQGVPEDILSRDIHASLGEALGMGMWVIGFTTSHVVFDGWIEDRGWGIYQQAFDMDANGTVTFTSDPEKVRLMTRIILEDANGDAINNQQGNNDMTLKTNANTNSSANAGKPLNVNNGTENAVDTNANATGTGEAASNANNTEGTKEGAPATGTNTETASTGNGGEIAAQARKPLSVQEYIANAPAELQEVLNSSVRVHNQQKDSAIKALKATGRCKFSDEYLKAQSLETLENLVEMAAIPSYEGRSGHLPVQADQSSGVPAAPKVFAKKVAGAA